MWGKPKLKFNKAGGAGGDTGGAGGAAGGAGAAGTGANNTGASGGGGILTPNQSGGSGNGAASGGAGAGNEGGSNNPQVVIPENWKLALPKELQEDTSLSIINDIPALAKSYINAQKLVGADKIVLPSKHATPEEWRAIYHKLGLPAKKEEYKVEGPKDSTVAQEFMGKFTEKAYELGIMPNQAKALAEFFDSENRIAVQTFEKSQKDGVEAGLRKLKEEWGAAFETNVNVARQALSHFADKETIAHIEKSGLTNDPHLVKLLAKVGGVLKEDGILKDNPTGSSALTPAAAQAEINKVMANPEHPYFHKEHAGHRSAVEEVSKLFSMTR